MATTAAIVRATFLSPRVLMSGAMAVIQAGSTASGPSRAREVERTDSEAISRKGRTIGVKAIQSGGRAEAGLRMTASSSSMERSAESRRGMSIRRFRNQAKAKPLRAEIEPTIRPAIPMVARSTPSSPATRSGPGVGGTSEWAIVAPATIERT